MTTEQIPEHQAPNEQCTHDGCATHCIHYSILNYTNDHETAYLGLLYSNKTTILSRLLEVRHNPHLFMRTLDPTVLYLLQIHSAFRNDDFLWLWILI